MFVNDLQVGERFTWVGNPNAYLEISFPNLLYMLRHSRAEIYVRGGLFSFKKERALRGGEGNEGDERNGETIIIS